MSAYKLFFLTFVYWSSHLLQILARDNYWTLPNLNTVDILLPSRIWCLNQILRIAGDQWFGVYPTNINELSSKTLYVDSTNTMILYILLLSAG